jgi:ubiquinone biosynthesis protein
MLSSAMFVGSSMMLSAQSPPLLGGLLNLLFVPETWTDQWSISRLSILGLTGCVTSILVGLRLIIAIAKSGHLDHKE